MKFVGLLVWEEWTDEMTTKATEIQELRKKNPGKYPKKLRLEDGTIAQFGLIAGGLNEAVIIYDADDPEQLAQLAVFWRPDVTFTFIPARQPSE
jgi:hypothetical protein